MLCSAGGAGALFFTNGLSCGCRSWQTICFILWPNNVKSWLRLDFTHVVNHCLTDSCNWPLYQLYFSLAGVSGSHLFPKQSLLYSGVLQALETSHFSMQTKKGNLSSWNTGTRRSAVDRELMPWLAFWGSGGRAKIQCLLSKLFLVFMSVRLW